MTSLKTEEISPIWKYPHAGSKRRFIKETIVNIYNQIPTEKKFDNHRKSLKKTLDTLWYMAPEILNNAWVDIFDWLEKCIPFYDDKTRDPKWIQNINTVWVNGNKIIVAGFSDDDEN